MQFSSGRRKGFIRERNLGGQVLADEIETVVVVVLGIVVVAVVVEMMMENVFS